MTNSINKHLLGITRTKTSIRYAKENDIEKREKRREREGEREKEREKERERERKKGRRRNIYIEREGEIRWIERERGERDKERESERENKIPNREIKRNQRLITQNYRSKL